MRGQVQTMALQWTKGQIECHMDFGDRGNGEIYLSWEAPSLIRFFPSAFMSFHHVSPSLSPLKHLASLLRVRGSPSTEDGVDMVAGLA